LPSGGFSTKLPAVTEARHYPPPVLVIDAYNVLHTTGILPPDIAGLDLDGLIRLLGQGRYAAQKVMLVCDGLPPGLNAHSARHDRARTPSSAGDALTLSRGKGMQILYSGSAEADAIIEDLVAKAQRTQKPLVVSSDRRVQAAAKKRRFAVISSERFLHQLADDHAAAGKARTVGPSPRELVPLEANLVAMWAKALGFDAPPGLLDAGSATVDEGERKASQPPPRSTPLFIGADRPRSKATSQIPAVDGSLASIAGIPAAQSAAEREAARQIDMHLDAQVTAILRRAKQAQTAAVRARPELPMAVSTLTNAAGNAAMASGKVRTGSKWAKHTSAADTQAETLAKSATNPSAEPSSLPRQIDPQLESLLKNSSERPSAADLDMSKWLSLPNAMADHARQPDEAPSASGKRGRQPAQPRTGKASPRRGRK